MGKRTYQNFILVGIAVLLAGLSMAMVQYKVPTIMTTLMDAFDLTASGGSWLMSIFTLMAVFTSIIFGSLSQRYKAKNIVIVAAILIVIGSVVGAFSHAGWLLIVSRAIEGTALTAMTTCGPIIVQKCVHPSKISSTMGIWGIWGPLGSVFAALLTPSLYKSFGFTALWIIYAIVVVVIVLFMYAIIKEPSGEDLALDAQPQNNKDVEAYKPRYRDLFTRNTVLFYLAFIAFNICMLAVLSFVPTILQMQGFSDTTSGFVSTLPMLLSVISSPLVGVIADKIGSPKIPLVCTMVFLGPCAFILYTQTGTIMWVAAVFMGLFGMGSTGVLIATYTRSIPRPELVPIGMGVLTTVQGIGQFLGSFMVQGLLGADLSNWYLAGGVVMVLTLLGTVCACFIKLKAIKTSEA